jgi:hypothetical protein
MVKVTYGTREGGTIEFTTTETGVDVHTRNAYGDSISSVVLRKDEAALIMAIVVAQQ